MFGHKKNIYLATCGFPWGKGEKSFILPELPLLSDMYQVTILACASDKIVEQEQWHTKLDDKIRVLRFPDNPLRVEEKLLETFRAMTSAIMWKEVFKILQGREKIMARIMDSLNFYVVANRYRRWLEKEKILCDEKAIFYSFWSTTYHLAAVMEKKKYPKLKIVSRLHGFDLYNERCIGRRQPFKKYLDSNSDMLLFASDYGLKYYINLFTDEKKKCKICHIGIKGVRNNGRHRENKTFYLISCSNVISIKRVDLIVKALARIKDISIQWTHFGDGEELLKIKEEARVTLSENVEAVFKGYINNDFIQRYYREYPVDCFITTSATEGGCPVSIMEAMSAYTPIIGTDVGGISSMIDGNGVLLAKNPTEEEIEKAIRYIYNMDEQSLELMRNRSYEIWNEKFNEEKNVNEVLEIMNQLFEED